MRVAAITSLSRASDFTFIQANSPRVHPITVPYSVSIIICSCNRSAALKQTLDAFLAAVVPPGWIVEIVVVDNASTDDTAAAVQGYTLAKPALRYIYEPRRGKGNALNAGLSAAKGDVILFTDDDVIPAKDWIEQLALPLFRGEADAVGGKILLAPRLSRPWSTEYHKRWLAWCEWPSTDPLELVGANMGLHRRVLRSVPSFDPELGPGAAGLGEDTLFGWQVSNAGLKMKFIPQAVVVHNPDTSRLQRSSWLNMAKSHGRKDAYILHHWKHEAIHHPRTKSLYLRLKLILRRLLQPPGALDNEGCARWEMSYVGDIEMCRAFLDQRLRPRNYPRRAKKQLG